MTALRTTIAKPSVSEAREESDKAIALQNELMRQWAEAREGTQNQNGSHGTTVAEPPKQP